MEFILDTGWGYGVEVVGLLRLAEVGLLVVLYVDMEI